MTPKKDQNDIRRPKNTPDANYTIENEGNQNPGTTQLTHHQTPHPNKILKNNSDVIPQSGIMTRNYTKLHREREVESLKPVRLYKVLYTIKRD